jgi:hypothetical protein
MKPVILFAAAAVLALSPPASAGKIYSEQLCLSWFKKLDRNRDGSIGGGEDPQGYVERATLAFEDGSSRGNFLVGKAFFMRECGNGIMGKPRL